MSVPLLPKISHLIIVNSKTLSCRATTKTSLSSTLRRETNAKTSGRSALSTTDSSGPILFILFTPGSTFYRNPIFILHELSGFSLDQEDSNFIQSSKICPVVDYFCSISELDTKLPKEKIAGRLFWNISTAASKLLLCWKSEYITDENIWSWQIWKVVTCRWNLKTGKGKYSLKFTEIQFELP